MYYKTRQTTKYKNVKQHFKGSIYDSKKEAEVAMWLDSELRQGKIKGVRRQVRIELRGENGSLIAHYKIDFVIDHLDGTEEYLEVKGFETPVWRMKWKMLEDKFGHDHSKKLTVIKV